MSDADFLADAFHIISSRSSEIEEKIDRLQQAKYAIEDEQGQAYIEIKQIKKPSLVDEWEGAKANTFDEDRQEAYEIMQNTINDYHSYVTQINWKIAQLQMQQSALDTASTIAYQADRLLDQGEEAVEAFGQKVNELKGALFE
ncbi:YwqH-like family protein [Paraliobacillus ryukyuensis]|uniref:YwqH-like family protein n=1 Tax=Paraliobacillus ryukyuensis TaxID=200904 RepID=UPI0009A7D26E|nr:DUF5082 family protein [Paraliobacillus ryukyuensis]